MHTSDGINIVDSYVEFTIIRKDDKAVPISEIEEINHESLDREETETEDNETE